MDIYIYIYILVYSCVYNSLNVFALYYGILTRLMKSFYVIDIIIILINFQHFPLKGKYLPMVKVDQYS